ncbi:uncharacterized protein LOC143299070 isoform X2 [Babylonia areolata]|uniref:uncharacterized protein LOC143299070 isoform X2 n=1 Tax=Babylonia areolata TaxID=304850 RepID=UPI003FD3F98F
MSFPKAQVKRFNETSGCAPPVGAYDPRYHVKASGGVIEKGERFKHPKDVSDNLRQDSVLSLSNPSLCSTPIKGSNHLSISSSSTESLGQSMPKKGSVKKPEQTEHMSRIKDMELEIRRLLREKSEKDKELQRLLQEQKRLEGRLNVANSERSSCLARSAQLEHEARDAKRGLEILQKQVSSTETSGRKKEDKLKEEVQSLQTQIHSKEREIQITQKQIVQALLALVNDTEQCAKHSDGLIQLFSRLELNADVTESEDEEKLGTTDSDGGFKQIDSQIKRAHRNVMKVSCYVSKLAESGVVQLDGLQNRLAEEHNNRLQQMSLQLADTHLQHQQLQNQLSQQQQEHEQRLSASQQQRQEEYDSMQTEIRRLQQDCEQAEQRLGQTLEEYNAIQLRLQQSQEEHQSSKHQMQQDMELRLTQEQQALEHRLREEQEAVERRLKEECAALECRLQESRELRTREVGELREELRQKEAQLAQLESSLLDKQVEHDMACQELQEEIERLQQKVDLAEQEMQESEEWGDRIQERVNRLQNEVDSLVKSRDSLAVEKDIARKELELKENLLAEALQENETLDSSIRSITAKFQCNIEDLEAVLAEEKKKSNQMSARFSAAEEEREKMSEELNQTQLVNRDLVESLSIFKDEVSSLKANSCELKKQLEEERLTSTELQTANQDLQTQLEDERQTATDLQTANKDLQTQLGDERQTATDLQTANKDLQTQLEDERQTATDLQTANKDLQTQLEDERQTATDLQTANKDLQTQLEDERQTATDLQTANKDLQTQLEDERQTATDLQTANKDLQTQLEDDRQTATDLQTANKDLQTQLEDERQTATDLQTANQDLQTQLEDEKETATNLQAEIKGLQLRLEEQQMTADTACREARTRVEQLEVENKQHQIANEALKGQLTHLTDLHTKETAQLKDKCHSLAQEKQRLGEKHKEDLQSVRKALALDRQANDLQMEELNLKLERAQAFNSQMKEELKKLLKDNEKLKDDSRAEVAALQLKVQTAEAQVTEATDQLDLLRHQAKHAQAEWCRLKSVVGDLEASLASKEEEVAGLQGDLHTYRTQVADQHNTLTELQAEKEALEEHFNRLSGEHSLLETDMEKQLHAVQEAALEERAEYERMMTEMSEKIQQLEEEQEQTNDDDEWRQKYEDLFARVEPFMEQLDAFAAEKTLLVGRSEMAEAEIAKMMDKYAKLLGHQNQKQKIQYINKLKDDYLQCRKEKEALKEKSNKMQNTIQKLEKKIQTLEGKKTFDTSLAFKHAAKKEDTAKAVSKPGEHMHSLKTVTKQDEAVRSPLKLSNK